MEALLRYDHYKPDTTFASQTRNRTIAGVAYWFPHQGNVSSALMFDYDGQSFDNFTPASPAQKRLAVHALGEIFKRRVMTTKLLATVVCAAVPRDRRRRSKRADQRSWRHVSVRDLFEAVR